MCVCVCFFFFTVQNKTENLLFSMPAIFFLGGFSPVLEDSETLINTTKDVGVCLL